MSAAPASEWNALKERDDKSPSLQDGFNGAGDARHLEWYADNLTNRQDLTSGIVRVQCTRQTRALLKRAGHKRCTMHDSYPVRVFKDRMGRLQLAPLPEVAMKDEAQVEEDPRPARWVADCGMMLECVGFEAEGSESEVQIGEFTFGEDAHEAAEAWNATYGATIDPENLPLLVEALQSLCRKMDAAFGALPPEHEVLLKIGKGVAG